MDAHARKEPCWVWPWRVRPTAKEPTKRGTTAREACPGTADSQSWASAQKILGRHPSQGQARQGTGVQGLVRVPLSLLLPHVPSVALGSSEGSTAAGVLAVRVTRTGVTGSMSARGTKGRRERAASVCRPGKEDIRVLGGQMEAPVSLASA